MNRRAVLAVALGAFTGCTGKPTDLATPRPTSSSTAIEEASPNEPSSTVDAPSLAELGNPPTVCAGGLVDLGIYAIDDPVFDTDWSTVTIPDQYSEDGELGDTVVIGIETDRGARAYPLSILWYHEIVNDTLPDSDDPILVTYCSLCRSGMVAERIVAGSPTIFGVTGQLWQPPELEAHASADQSRVFAVEPNDPAPGSVRTTGNLVMFDEATGSYWSQLLAQAICGPREGDQLTIVPSRTARWTKWRDDHPDTDVLLPPPHSSRQSLPG